MSCWLWNNYTMTISIQSSWRCIHVSYGWLSVLLENISSLKMDTRISVPNSQPKFTAQTLVTIGKILTHVNEIKFRKVVSWWRKGLTLKTWISSCLLTQEDKSLFHCSRPKGLWVMAVCLRHVETIIFDQCFFTDFILVYSEERGYKKNLMHHWILLFIGCPN